MGGDSVTYVRGASCACSLSFLYAMLFPSAFDIKAEIGGSDLLLLSPGRPISGY